MRPDLERLKALADAAEARMATPARTGPQRDLAVVRQAVAEALASVGWMAAEHIREEHRLGQDLGLKTLGRIEVAMILEEELSLRVRLDVVGWCRVADVVRDVAAA